MYFISYASHHPSPTKATTLTAAKRAAARACPFQGQTLKVFQGHSASTAECVAIRRTDAINGRMVSDWEDLAPSYDTPKADRKQSDPAPVYSIRVPKPLHDNLLAAGPGKVRKALERVAERASR